MRNHRSGLVIAVLLLTLPGIALAATTGSDAVGQILGDLLNRFNGLVSKQPFLQAGTRLLQMLMVILIAWKGLRLTLDTGSFSMVIAELANIILMWGIASFLMNPSVQQQFTSGFDDLAKMAANSTGSILDVANPANAISDALGRLMDAAMKLYNGTPIDPPPNADASMWARATSWLNSTIGSVASGDVFFALANVLFRVFLAILVLVVGLIYAVTIIWTQISINIALVMAPLMVPWMLWDSMAFLFHSWLKFLITCGVQKIVGALVFGVTAALIDNVTTMATKANATPVENFYYYAATFLIVAVMAALMVQIVSVANGLISGMPNSTFKPSGLMSPGGATTRGGGAMQKGVSQAASGAAAGGRAAKGAFQGFKAGMQNGGGVRNVAKSTAQGAWAAMKGGGGPKVSAPPALPKSPAKGGE